MNLEAVKAFIEGGQSVYNSVSRLKSRTFWMGLLIWMGAFSVGIAAAGTDVDVVWSMFLIMLFAYVLVVLKSISTDVRETLETRSKDRLKEQLARCEADVEVARTQQRFVSEGPWTPSIPLPADPPPTITTSGDEPA